MPRNSSNTDDITRGTGGPPAPDRSTYAGVLSLNDARTDPNSENQLAQNSNSDPSRQYDDNNRGANSASRGNSSSNATSGQSYRYPQGDGYSSSSSNRNQNDNHDDGSFIDIRRPLGSTNTGSQSYGGTNSSSNPLSDSSLASRETQSVREQPWHAIGSVRSDSRGGFGGRGSAGGDDQSGGYGREYDNRDGDGDGDSLSMGRGSRSSGRSSGGRN